MNGIGRKHFHSFPKIKFSKPGKYNCKNEKYCSEPYSMNIIHRCHCRKYSFPHWHEGRLWIERVWKATSYPLIPLDPYELAGSSFPIRKIQRRKGKKYRYIMKEIQIKNRWKETAFSAIQFRLYPPGSQITIQKSNFLSDISNIQWIKYMIHR